MPMRRAAASSGACSAPARGAWQPMMAGSDARMVQVVAARRVADANHLLAATPVAHYKARRCD
ncbi:hypothetical protein TP47_02470 [Xanthomonas citri pv. aurantifolii]|uniref:Uncharacterized protein n=1 Tax=Xanthomonas citri pv. vignicola TaxID=473426 RepID=A0AB33CCD8_XANCI|nr:hypothetical protein TP50_00320 [Xanthomonas citri pv. aurantifolii]ASK90184.1 hypothetical protein XcvCFBP7111P_00325 [Xanthomonas citri pv. vignicola]MBZ3919357.1 hypothetical protein [Xanthomonas campestris pv. trichodesmae]TBW98188.1 hypothetical protein TP49_07915 [Xanthomonas citri pv. aurantifolii]TBX00752.1 hypothetical protein TP47_02470 [Xanthomonas citri pv. aurantifolii]